MKTTLKQAMKDYEIGIENVSRYTPTIVPEKHNYFEQWVESPIFENHPGLEKFISHWIFDFSSSIFSILVWLSVMSWMFGPRTLIALLIPLSAMGSIGIMLWFTHRGI